jgi:hypothetical protein
MQVNNHDILKLIEICNETNIKVARIEEKVIAIHSCNGEQDAKLAIHENKLGLLDKAVAQINVKLVGLFVVGAATGGIIASIVTKLIGF